MIEFLTAMAEWFSPAAAILTRLPLLMRAFTRARRHSRVTDVVQRPRHVLVVIIRVDQDGGLG
jgi:hypothetical protein